jgi:hypothetical protein
VAQRIVEAPFPWPAGTADAEDVAQLRFANGILRLAYKNMDGVSKEVEFRGVAGFRWTSATPDGFAGLRDDFVYEVLDSDWVRDITAENMLPDKPPLRHYVIGFNEESSWLEIVFEAWADVA